MRFISFAPSAILLSILIPSVSAQCAGGSCPTTAFRVGPSFASPLTYQAIPQHIVTSAPVIYDSPVVYEYKDSTGQAWQHRDKAYLSAWIAGRNAGFKAQAELAEKTKAVEAFAAKDVTKAIEAKPVEERPPTAQIDHAYDVKPLAPATPPVIPVLGGYQRAG